MPQPVSKEQLSAFLARLSQVAPGSPDVESVVEDVYGQLANDGYGYPFEKYGMLDGRVVHVGPDASDVGGGAQGRDATGRDASQDHSASSLNYKALVALDAQGLSADGEKFKLLPGMQVVAEIRQGRRTVLEYLLSPLKKTVHDSARER